ncbi:MAG: endonuclease III domain-containing protein [Eubacteriales bacterium]
MTYTEKAAETVRRLRILYPGAECALRYDGEPWRLLVMAILSAQCTDLRVNFVSKDLFSRFPTLKFMADADVFEIEEAIKSCGLYHTKAANIKASCEMILNDFNGIVPDTVDELLKLPGVGRKIANLIVGDIYGKPAIVTDTHCIRLSGRLGFTPEDERRPERVEKTLTSLIEPSEQSDFCHRLVLFGREVCKARKPSCGNCPFCDLCIYYKANYVSSC